MVDEGGAMFCGVKEAFGDHVIVTKLCQWHLKSDTEKKSNTVGREHRQEFCNVCKKMCSVSTVTHINPLKSHLDDLLRLYTDIKWWIEIGNSFWKRENPLNFVDACKDHTTTMFIQEEKFWQFDENDGLSSTKCPNKICRATDDCISRAEEGKRNC